MENLGGWDQSEDHPDFDPNLLANVDSWAVDDHNHEHVVNVSLGMNEHNNHHNSHNSQRKSRSNSNQWTNLDTTDFGEDINNNDPVGMMEKSSCISDNSNGNRNDNINSNHQATSSEVAISTETVEAAVEAAVAVLSETSDSVTSGDRSANGTTTCSSETSSSSKERITQYRLHPLGIQSSANCPGHTIAHGNQSSDHSSNHYNNKYPTMSLPMPQQNDDHRELCSVDLSKALERSVSAPASTVTNPHNPSTAMNQHISSLATNFMLAQSGYSSLNSTAANHHHQQHRYPQQCNSLRNGNGKTTVPSSKTMHKSKNNGKRQSRNFKADVSATGEKPDNASATAVSSSSLPPFYLFDAPVELRANFMQNQRRLGLPIQNDPNSYHYGETVNGFHPHQYQLPAGSSTAAAGTGTISATNGTTGGIESNNDMTTPTGAAATVTIGTNRPKHVPKLIDARHGNPNRKNKGGQVKNEREQKRAQKITELIEQLRLQMEEGGWQVEARSKFHTLFNCAEYVKHMIAHTSEKEKENEKLKTDLDEKRRQFEREKEEKAIQEGRSDPESVTSSLTSDTTLSSSRHKEAEDGSNGGRNNNDNTTNRNSKRKQLLSESNRGEVGSLLQDNNNKKRCTAASCEATTEESSGEDMGGGSGSGSGSGSGGPSAHGCSISKTISTVSDITDSNRGSSSNNSGSGGGSSDDVPTEQESPSGNDDEEENPSTSSISSDAAVASEKTSRDRHSCHKDVVFNNDKRMSSRKRPPEEVTSLERSFELNYEEVFNKSNIPQLIASTSGKIVTWNECFAKVTGYRKCEIERMTIFSLVKPENLANFFEIVAAALRPPGDEGTEKKNEKRRRPDDDKIKNNLSENLFNGKRSAENDELLEGKIDCSQDNASCSSTENNCRYDEEVRDRGSSPSVEVNNCKIKIEEGEEDEQVAGVEGKNDVEISAAIEVANTTNKCLEMKKMKEEEIETIQQQKYNMMDYTAMTLPCIDFPAMRKRNHHATADSDSVAIPPLHVTVTLMSDKDPRRRCFHCVFTNSKGTNGCLGIITPELLASLFKPSRRRKKHLLSSHHHGHQSRKRARGSSSSNEKQQQQHSVKQISNAQPEKPPSPLLMPRRGMRL